MTIGREQCTFQLFVYNDGEKKAYELGEKLSGTVSEQGYDCFVEDVQGSDLYAEIAQDLYEKTEGAMEYHVHIYIEYTRDWEGEYDIDWYYDIDAKRPTDCFEGWFDGGEPERDAAPQDDAVPYEDEIDDITERG